MEHLTNRQIVEISIAMAGSLLLGLLIRKLLFPFLYRLTRKTKWKSDDLVIESIGQWILFWFFLGACLYILPILTGAFGFVKRNESIFIDIIISLFIFSTAYILARIVAGLLQIRSQQDDSEIPTSSILGNIAKAIIYCVGFILILQRFGVEIAPLVAALGIGGIAVALALQPTLSNLFSGLQMIASRKFNIGDFIQLESGQRGIIRDITWRNTTLETSQNNVIMVPNSKMADSVIENFFLDDREIVFNVIIRVGYESDLEKVERISIQVAREILKKMEGGIKDYEPVVRFFNFGENCIDCKVFMRVKEYDYQFLIASEFIKAFHRQYDQDSIVIPHPNRTIKSQEK